MKRGMIDKLTMSGCAVAVSVAAHGQVVRESVRGCAGHEDGTLGGGTHLMDVDRTPIDLLQGTNVVTLINNGPVTNRVDVVFVGDGYTAGQLGLYASHVQNMVNAFFSAHPYSSYASYFNIHRVDVVSPESGVDHDPTYPTWRNTALHMGFWCNGTERLLCVNVGTALSYANLAPDRQQIVAVANSTKYGGAGYTALATAAGGNSSAIELMRHEMGHSFGLLADEYGGNCTYNGPEPAARNASTYTAAVMQSTGAKWANWLNYNGGSAYDGIVSTYQGAVYCDFGVYRPSNNSLMRNLFRPFNLPSIEGLVIELYKVINPIDNATPAGTYDGSHTLFVTPMQPNGHSLNVQWYANNNPIAGQTSVTLTPNDAGLASGTYSIAAKVWDATTFVRDEAARNLYMTSTRSWQVNVTAPVAGDVTGDGVVNVNDLLAVIDSWGACAECPPSCPGDIWPQPGGDCQVNINDLLHVINHWS